MALMEAGLLILFGIIVLALVVGAFFLWGLKYAIALAINSVIGFFALYAIKAFVWETLVINVWSVIFVAIGGIVGFGFVLLLHGLGLWF